MDNPESPPACNFPEILARDLEISEATFLAKSMTAGAPICGVATRAPERQKQPLCVSIDDQSPRVHWEDVLSKDGSLGVIDEASYHSDSDDNDTMPSEIASLTSDSGTESGQEMEPPTIRMRRGSVCMAVTSVAAHCLPPKEQPGYSLVALEDSYQGQSWIDLDMEDSEDDEHGEAQTARPGPQPKDTPECAGDLPNASVLGFPSPSGPDKLSGHQGNGFSPSHPPSLDRVLVALPASSFSSERPHTSSGVPAQEKPHHLVEIASSPSFQKRFSTSEDLSRGVTSRSLFEFERHPTHSWASAGTTLASEASDFNHEIIQSETCRVSKPNRYQARMSGRKVIGGTPEPVPTGSSVAGDVEPTQDEIINVYLSSVPQDDEHPTADISDGGSVAANERMSRVKIPPHLVDAILSAAAHQPATNPTDLIAAQASQVLPSPGQLSDNSDSSLVETFFRSKIALPDAHTSSSRELQSDDQSRPSTAKAPVNMRLHPDVFYRLEASISGFPDTMLSTRALPIDIIRSLPKKLDYRDSSATLTVALEQPDLAAPPPTPSKWKVSSLRKRDPRPPTPSSPAPSSAAQPSPASIIRRVFPQGNAHHCDSLYAHLVAYIYISSLCGHDAFFSTNDPSAMATTTTSLSPNTRKTRNIMHRIMPGEASSSSSTAIPRKASMFLGMDKATPTPDPTGTPKLSKMRSLFKGKGTKTKEEGQMVPAKNAGGGRSRPVTERDVKEVQAGLLRCIRNLAAKLKTDDGRGGGETGVLREDDFEVDAEGWRVLDPYLLRALCEIVRAEEERLGAAASA